MKLRLIQCGDTFASTAVSILKKKWPFESTGGTGMGVSSTLVHCEGVVVDVGDDIGRSGVEGHLGFIRERSFEESKQLCFFISTSFIHPRYWVLAAAWLLASWGTDYWGIVGWSQCLYRNRRRWLCARDGPRLRRCEGRFSCRMGMQRSRSWYWMGWALKLLC